MNIVKYVLKNEAIADHLENAPCHSVVAGNMLFWKDPQTGTVHEFFPKEKHFLGEKYLAIPDDWATAQQEVHWDCGLPTAAQMVIDRENQDETPAILLLRKFVEPLIQAAYEDFMKESRPRRLVFGISFNFPTKKQ